MMTIKQQQTLLTFLDCYVLERKDGSPAIDGISGQATKAAIRLFQMRYNVRPDGSKLVVDGLWGPATEKAIREVIGNTEKSQIKEPEIPAIPAENVEKTIWEALVAQGFPPAAVAGIMGNLCAESALKPNNMEDQYQSRLGFNDESYTKAVDNGSYTNFAHDSVGYGLAQWTWHTRKLALLDMAKKAGRSIADPGVQIAHLLNELHRHYPSLERQLKSPDNSVYYATKRFMFIYEDPFDKSDSAVSARVTLAQKYYNRYA